MTEPRSIANLSLPWVKLTSVFPSLKSQFFVATLLGFPTLTSLQPLPADGSQFHRIRLPQEFEGLNAPGPVTLPVQLAANGTAAIGSINYQTSPEVYWTSIGGVTHVWPPAGFEFLDFRGISGDGTKVVGRMVSVPDRKSHAFTWTPETGFTYLIPPGSVEAIASDISVDGRSVLITSDTTEGGAAKEYWLWNEDEGYRQLPRDLDALGNLRGFLGRDSTIVYRNAYFDLETEELTPLPDPVKGQFPDRTQKGQRIPGVFSLTEGEEASCIDRREDAALWSLDGTVQRLGVLEQFDHVSGLARGATSNSEIVVGRSGGGDWCHNGWFADRRAFVWDELHGMREIASVLAVEYGLDVSHEWGLTEAVDISDDGRTILGRAGGGPAYNWQADFWIAELDWPIGTVHGDLDRNETLDVADVNKLQGVILNGAYDSQSDFDFDSDVDDVDLRFWVHELKTSFIGDANLDGEFNSSDLVAVFEGGLYENGDGDAATWATGDWNADGRFTTRDLVAAFQDGGYEQGPRTTHAVPEPSTWHAVLAAMVSFLASIRSSNRRK